MYRWFCDWRRATLIACAVSILLMTGVGCVPSPLPEATATAPPEATATAPPEATATPVPAWPGAQRGRTLVIAVPGNITTVDAQIRSGDMFMLEAIWNMNAQLLDPKVFEEDGQLYSSDEYTEGWLGMPEWNEDHTVWTFHVRPGLKFANGDPITKEDWEWNFDRFWGAKTVTSVFFALASATTREHVEVVDDTTIRINYDVPNTLAEPFFASNCSGVINSKIAKQHATEDDPWATEWLRTNNVGAGPFKLESWTSDEIVLVKNDNYFEAPEKPWFDKVIYKIVPDPTTRVALLNSGDVDVAYGLPLEALPELEQNPNLTVYNIPSTGIAHLVMNVNVPPFDDVKVRQAINYAIPYDTIVEEVMMGYGRRMYNCVPDGMPGFDPTVPHYDTDYEKAKQLLSEAGYPDGFSAELVIRAEVREDEKTAIWVQNGLREVGIDVKIIKMPSAAYLEQSRLMNIPFYVKTGWLTTTNDPLIHLNWLFRAPCCNFADYKNERIYYLIDTYFLSTDVEARMAAAREIQEIVYAAAPWAPLYQPEYVLVADKDIQGIVLAKIRGQVSWRFAYRAEE